MSPIASLFVFFVIPILKFLMFLIFVSVILSWLVGFNIINLRNPTMRQIYNGIDAITRPIMDPIRKVVPAIGGLDFSPIIALLGLQWLIYYVIPSLINMI